MKNPTKFISIFALAICIFSTSNLIGQQCWDDPTIKDGPIWFPDDPIVIIEVPEWLKSQLSLPDANTENSKTVSQYVEEFQGCTRMMFDNEKRIIAIGVPERSGLERDALLRYFEQYTESDPIEDCMKEDSSWKCIFSKLREILKKQIR